MNAASPPDRVVKIALPPASDAHFTGALEIVDRLRRAGYQVFFAGGCVRDLVRGETPKDYDVVTNARPEQVDALFKRTVLVGASFGVVRVILRDGFEYEVATYRRDAEYTDGRRPDRVEYSDSKEEDVERRDFTINALLLDPNSGEVIDHVGGIADLEAGVIRAVGDPERRFQEDRLRMLRAVRFAARLGFRIEPETLRLITAEAPQIVCVSVERIVTELEGIFLSKDPARGLELLVSTGLFPHVLPFVPAEPTVFTRLGPMWARLPGLASEFSTEARVLSAWASVLGFAPGNLDEHLRRLKLSRQHARFIQRLIQAQPLLLAPEAQPEHERVRLGVDPDFRLFLAYLAVIAGRESTPVERWRQVDQALVANPLPPLPLVTGEDLKALGVAPGPAFKDLLRRVECEIFERRVRTREEALAFTQGLLGG